MKKSLKYKCAHRAQQWRGLRSHAVHHEKLNVIDRCINRLAHSSKESEKDSLFYFIEVKVVASV